MSDTSECTYKTPIFFGVAKVKFFGTQMLTVVTDIDRDLTERFMEARTEKEIQAVLSEWNMKQSRVTL